MKKIYTLLFVLTAFLLIETDIVAQDLIQRTQQGIEFTCSAVPNEIAKQLANIKRTSSARNANFDPFEIAPTINSVTQNFTSEGVFLNLKEEVITTLLKNQLPMLTLNIPADVKSSFALDLYKVNVYAEDFMIRL